MYSNILLFDYNLQTRGETAEREIEKFIILRENSNFHRKNKKQNRYTSPPPPSPLKIVFPIYSYTLDKLDHFHQL